MADNKKTPKASSKSEKDVSKYAKSEKKSEKTSDKKAEKKSNAEQSGVKKFFGSIKQFFKDVRGETKKIVWNSKEETIKGTGVVLAVTVVIGAVVWVLDLAFRGILDALVLLSNGSTEAAMIMLQSLTDLL